MTTDRMALLIDAGEETIEISFSPETILQVWREYEAENPGKVGSHMSSEEFSRRMVEKMKESARLLPRGRA